MTNIAKILHYECGLGLSAIGQMSKVNPTTNTVRKWVKSGADTPSRTINVMFLAILGEWGTLANQNNPASKHLWTALFPRNPRPHIYHIIIYRHYRSIDQVAEWTGLTERTIQKILRSPRITKRQLRLIAPAAQEIYVTQYNKGEYGVAGKIYLALRDHKRLSN